MNIQRAQPHVLEAVRQEVVLAIAFLGRDAGTDRLPHTIEGVLTGLARADEAIRKALAAPPTVGQRIDAIMAAPAPMTAEKAAELTRRAM